MSLCKHCVSGVRHEGTPTGSIETINGVKTYVALPKVDYPKDKAILFLPDAFGLELINNQLLADDFAANGFQTYLIDLFSGDPVPEDALNTPGQFDFKTWFGHHGKDVTRPLIDNVTHELKERGITEFAAIGFCFGARYTFDLAFDGEIKAAAVSHPSLLVVPDDLHKFKQTGIPLLINSCEVDQMYPPEAQKLGDDILGDGKPSAEKYERTYWPGCTHGFAVRGDMSNPQIKAGKEGAFKATVEWLIKYL